MIRLAIEEDIDFCFRIRNLPSTYKNCARARPLTKEEFLKTLKNTTIFIIKDKIGYLIGYIRFDKKKNSRDIGIAIRPEYWGMGHGKQALNEGMKLFTGNFTAIIQKNNISSQKIFEANGFIKINENKEFFFYKAS